MDFAAFGGVNVTVLMTKDYDSLESRRMLNLVNALWENFNHLRPPSPLITLNKETGRIELRDNTGKSMTSHWHRLRGYIGKFSFQIRCKPSTFLFVNQSNAECESSEAICHTRGISVSP